MAEIEIACDEATAGLWRALGHARRAHVGRLFVATVRAQARLEADELAARLRELRRKTEDAAAATPSDPPPVDAPPVDEPAPASNGQRWGVKDNGDGTATIQQRDEGMERVRERFDAARAEQRVTQPTDALPRGRGRSRMETVEVTDEAVVEVVRRLRRVSKSRVAIELGYRPGSKGYIAVGEVLERLARAGAGGPLIEDGRIRNGIGYRLRPGVQDAPPPASTSAVAAESPAPEPEPPDDEAETTTPDVQALERERLREREGLRNAGLLGTPSPRRTTPVERPARDARDARPPVAESAPEQPKPRAERAQAPTMPFTGTEEELRAEIVRLCTAGKRGVGGMADELKAPPARVAQAVQWLAQRGELVKEPPGVYSARAKVPA